MRLRLSRQAQFWVYIIALALVASFFYHAVEMGDWTRAVEAVIAFVLIMWLRVSMLLDVLDRDKGADAEDADIGRRSS